MCLAVCALLVTPPDINARNFLVRFGAWMAPKFGARHGYRASAAVMEWFLYDHLVADNADGHVSRSLFDGARVASEHFKFPFSVVDKAVRAFARQPSKAPKQAPSASVRILFHLHRGDQVCYFRECSSRLTV